MEGRRSHTSIVHLRALARILTNEFSFLVEEGEAVHPSLTYFIFVCVLASIVHRSTDRFHNLTDRVIHIRMLGWT
uniref:Uncharacterized protein n=1 Tax=Picea glauca TaxID=3330 RepID=A0A117NGL8_PICGL|nr:hypothetical protein ABT39_MTgene6007 [Picea glauca]QHR86842.1 hypothetical protein Q903MT_gene849 [Picea sitchensis]